MTRNYKSAFPDYPLSFTQKKNSKYSHPNAGPAPISTPIHEGLEFKNPSLVHGSSAARHGGTWDLDPDDFLFWVFFLDFFFDEDWSLWTGPPPPLEWNSFLPLVTALLITPKGAESPGSLRLGVMGVLVFSFHPRPSGRTVAEDFSPTPPRVHWIGPEFHGCIGVCISKHAPNHSFNDSFNAHSCW